MIGLIRPRDCGRKRFSLGASSAKASTTFSDSGAINLLFSAFATADRMTLETAFAEGLGKNWSAATAKSTRLPRTKPNTRRTFCGDIPIFLWIAFTGTAFLFSLSIGDW